MTDTIYAPSSALGGAVAVLRVSGPGSRHIVNGILSKTVFDAPGQLTHCNVLSAGGEVLDDCMAVFFASPHSYTGEDMLEIHCHGGYAAVSAVLNRLYETGAVPAQAGEFTKRAFLNGKMDLTRAEAVMDLVNAHADRSRRAALRQLKGGLESRVNEAEEMLLNALSTIDASLDYPDEMEEQAGAEVREQLQKAALLLHKLAQEGRQGRVLRDGITAVLCGKPNAGKSSLLNRLLEEERAIVTELPGTTRDIIREDTVFFGVPVHMVDTAGIRTADNAAEVIGIQRAKQAVETADIVLVLIDGSAPVSKEDEEILAETKLQRRLIVRTKKDLTQRSEVDSDISVSAVTGEGIDALKQAVIKAAGPGDSDGTVTNERHVAALSEAALAVEDALKADEADCVATDIRNALHALGQISGREADEDVIDRIFSRFCVGK